MNNLESSARQKSVEYVVAIAASAGGLQAINTIIAKLPADLAAAIVIVRHISANYRSYAVEIFSKQTDLKVQMAQTGMIMEAGNIYIAPPDHHVLIEADGSLSLSQSPKIHFVRPSAEPLFKSLAHSYQDRAIAVTLTGGDSDGHQGIQLVKQMGGRTIAQNQATSTVFGMPAAAIDTGCVDLVLPIEEIADAIVNLVPLKRDFEATSSTNQPLKLQK